MRTLQAVVLLIFGIVFLPLAPSVGAVLTLVSVVLMVQGFKGLKGRDSGSRPAGPAVRPPEPVKCPNPEPHRHYEAPAACPNPEPHRHYEAAPRKKRYDTFVDRDKKWPTAEERRLKNMRNLYDAGLLTREEYDDAVRKIRG